MKNIVILLLLVFACSVHAGERDKSDTAVANILFDYDGSEEFASYLVKDDGFVDINFASNMPDKLYAEILTKMQNHPDIDGVLAGKGGPVCKLW